MRALLSVLALSLFSLLSLLSLPVPAVRAGEEAAPAPPPLITPAVDRAVAGGLDYLARAQAADGSWSGEEAGGGYTAAMTGLAGLAFLAAGHTPATGERADQVTRAVDYLLACARARRGVIASEREQGRQMYGHGFGMLFLAQALGMTGSPAREREIRQALNRAIRVTAESQSPRGGWYYDAYSRDDEGSVTVTQIQALRACHNAGLAVDARVIGRAVAYIEDSRCPDGGIAYRAGDSGSRPAITAAAVATLYNAGRYDSPLAEGALEYCRRELLGPGRGRWSHSTYTHFYLAQALHQAGGEDWTSYYRWARGEFLAAQRGDGAWEGDYAGPVYGTSITLFVLLLPREGLPITAR